MSKVVVVTGAGSGIGRSISYRLATDGHAIAAVDIDPSGLVATVEQIVATGGTAQAISRMGVPVETIHKLHEGSPNVVDYIERGEVDLVINTPTGSGARADGYEIRSAATRNGIPCVTTMTGASAAARAIGAGRNNGAIAVRSLQELHEEAARAGVDGA